MGPRALREVPAQAVAATLVARDVDHELQVRELDPQGRRRGAQAGAIVGVDVDLAQDGVEDVLELLLGQTVGGHPLTLNLRSTLPLAAYCGLDLAELVPDVPSALRHLVEQLDGAIAVPAAEPAVASKVRSIAERSASDGFSGTVSFMCPAYPARRPYARAVPHLPRPSTPYAPDVLLPGDPGRALALAQQLLTEPKMSNHARGLWGYTGRRPRDARSASSRRAWAGRAPRSSSHELAELGVRRAIRVGTCGALDPGLGHGELVVARRRPGRGRGKPRPGAGEAAEPDPELTARLAAGCRGGAAPARIVTTDLFYDGDPTDGPPRARRCLAQARGSRGRDGGGDALHARPPARRRRGLRAGGVATRSRTASAAGSATRIWRRRPSGWARWRRARRLNPDSRLRVARSLALPSELGDLAGELVERVLDRLEPLGDRPQPPGQAVDVVAGRQVQVADRLAPACEARSRAPNATWSAWFIHGLSTRNWASSPSAPSPREEIRSLMPSPPLSSISFTHGTATDGPRAGFFDYAWSTHIVYRFGQRMVPGVFGVRTTVPRCKGLGESVASAVPAGAGRSRPADPQGFAGRIG